MSDSSPLQDRKPRRFSRLAWLGIALLSGGLALWFVAARREVRLTLHNGAGETLRKVRVEYDSMMIEAPDVVAGGSTTLTFRLSPPPDSTAPRVALRYEMADGTPIDYPAWLDHLNYWKHIQFHADRHPNGAPLLFQSGGPPPWSLPLHELFGWMRGR